MKNTAIFLSKLKCCPLEGEALEKENHGLIDGVWTKFILVQAEKDS